MSFSVVLRQRRIQSSLWSCHGAKALCEQWAQSNATAINFSLKHFITAIYSLTQYRSQQILCDLYLPNIFKIVRTHTNTSDTYTYTFIYLASQRAMKIQEWENFYIILIYINVSILLYNWYRNIYIYIWRCWAIFTVWTFSTTLLTSAVTSRRLKVL